MIHKNYCMLGMDDKVSNFLLCFRDKHASSWKMILDSNFNMTLNSSLTASYSEHSSVSKSPTGHMAALKDSGLIDIWRWSHCDRSLSSPTNLPSNNFQLIFLTQALLCPEFIFVVFLSAQRNDNSTKPWLTEQSLSVWILKTVLFRKLFWAPLTKLVFTDHYSTLARRPCYLLSAPSHLSQTFQKL